MGGGLKEFESERKGVDVLVSFWHEVLKYIYVCMHVRMVLKVCNACITDWNAERKAVSVVAVAREIPEGMFCTADIELPLVTIRGRG